MEEQKNRYSIAEFAELVGVSKQAVYKRLDKDLADFLEVDSGKKYIRAEAAKRFCEGKRTAPARPRETDPGLTINFLLEQIAAKDRIIENQQQTITNQGEQIRDLEKHSMEQAEKLTEIFQEQQELQRNYQILLAQGRILSNSTEEEVESTVESTVENEEQIAAAPKKSIFRWLKRKKKG